MIVEARLAIGGHGGQAGGDGDRVAVVGAAVLAVAGRHQSIHDVAAAAEDAQRKAAADRLAQRTQVRRHAQVLLRSARAHAEGAQHLVEDQQHAVLLRSAAGASPGTPASGRMQPAL